MSFKLLSGFVVTFWLATTGLLIQMIYFPEESRFSEVPASQVIDLFLARGEREDMDLFSGKRWVGSVNVIPARKDNGRVRLLMDGAISVEIGELKGKVRLRSSMWMRRVGELESYSMKLEMRELGISCELSQHEGDESIHYIVRRGDTVLLDSSDAAASIDQQLQAQLLMRAWGIDIAQLRQQVMREGEQGGERVTMSARRGMINVEGARLKGYILAVKALGEAEIKFFFSEAGELLKMDSFLDYRLVNYQLNVDPRVESLRDDGKAEVIVPVPDDTAMPQLHDDAGKEAP